MSAVSSTFRAHYSMHAKERAISLWLQMCPSNQGSLAISFRSGTQSDPCISSVPTSIMITSSNSSARRSGIPSQLLGVVFHTNAMFGLSRVRTEFAHLLIIPSLAHHPEQLNGQLAGHRDLGNLPPAPHGQMKILIPPFRKAAHRHLRRFHQQETQYRTALLGDMAPAVADCRWNLPTGPVPDSLPPACRTGNAPPDR